MTLLKNVYCKLNNYTEIRPPNPLCMLGLERWHFLPTPGTALEVINMYIIF